MPQLRQFVCLAADTPTDGQVDLLLSRSDDMCVESDPAAGEIWVPVDREGPSLVDTVVSAVRDLDRVGIEASYVQEDDDLVTLGVIAQRIGRSERTVRRWARNEDGPGGFPGAVFIHPRRPLYSWHDVAPWLIVHFGHEPPDQALALRALNLVLELRSMAPEVERMSAIRSLLAS
jgi:hypothetical protein